MTLYEVAPLIHSADERVDGARPGVGDRVLRLAGAEAARLTDKLRLGGMALANGLLVHGPTHWAAAVRGRDGELRTASGPKPRLRRLDRVPGARGVVRLAEAMAVIPLARRALPEARLPFESGGRARRRGGHGGRRLLAQAPRQARARTPRRPRSRCCRRWSRCAAASSRSTTAPSTR